MALKKLSFIAMTWVVLAMGQAQSLPAQDLGAPPGMLLAQNAKGKGGKNAGGRRKILSTEARTKGSKTQIDFDAASIDGERRMPAGVAIGGAKQDQEYDLINLRLRWHPEMIKSTSNLETGKGQ